MNYVNKARAIVDKYFTDILPAEELKNTAKDQKKKNIITPEYYAECIQAADDAVAKHRSAADAALQALVGEYAQAVAHISSADGNQLDSADYKLLAADFPLTLEEFKALCDRTQNNPTVLRKAAEVGARRGWAPYATRYIKNGDDLAAKFAAFVRRVGPVLDSAPGSTYRSAQYWAFCVGDAAPFADV